MFKDFQLAKPPAIPARKGELAAGPDPASSGKQPGAFDQYFSTKVGLVQDAADHDDFEINKMPSIGNAKLAEMAYVIIWWLWPVGNCPVFVMCKFRCL